jgi:hypothetical protein
MLGDSIPEKWALSLGGFAPMSGGHVPFSGALRRRKTENGRRKPAVRVSQVPLKPWWAADTSVGSVSRL